MRYKAVVVDSQGRTASALAATTAGQTPAPARPTAVERDYAVVHYQRPAGDYDGWQLKADGQSAAFTGRDAYGAFAWVKVPQGASSLAYTVAKGDSADGPRAPSTSPHRRGVDRPGQGRPVGAGTVRRPPAAGHFQGGRCTTTRADGDYDGWGLHTWTGAASPTDWSKPLGPPAATRTG